MSPTTQAVLSLLEKHGDLTFTDMQPHLAAAKLEVEPTAYNAVKQAWKKKAEKGEKVTPQVAAKANTVAPADPTGPSVDEAIDWVKAIGGLGEGRKYASRIQALLAKAEEVSKLLS